jgi:ribonuclease E
LTGNLALPGRYLVLQPSGQGVNISRRIGSEGERNRLRALGVLVKPPGAGLLIRTEADGISEELLIDDLESLLRQWEAIQKAAETASPPVLLNRDEDFIHRILRDHTGLDLDRVVVESPAAVERVRSFLGDEGSHVVVEAHPEPSELLEDYKVNGAIRDALKPRVDLPSGGYVIIEPTEALTVIDVNSGSFTRSANARETVLWTNCEAAIEIARQLRLRNIGGVIIVDFIDMDSRRDQLQLLEHFTGAIRDDAARPQIAQLTELGLVELTRKRQGQNIYELFGRACPSCGGLGHVAVLPGKDLMQPLATATGLVRSAASARAEVPQAGEASNARRRRGGRGKVVTASGPADSGDAPLEEVEIASGAATSAAIEPASVSRRQDPELVAVPMDEDEEQVYGWLGLNPALLLESQPELDNLMVRIVRPGEDAEQVLEQARQQMSANSGRRRRRGPRGNGRSTGTGSGRPAASAGGDDAGPTTVVTPSEQDDPSQPLLVEITPLIETPVPVMSPEPVAVSVAEPASVSISEPVVSAEPEVIAEPADTSESRPGRRRRRSSASTSDND